MKKSTVYVMLIIIISIFLGFVSFDYCFIRVNVKIDNISFVSPYLYGNSLERFDIQPQYKDASIKAVCISATFNNQSFIKKYHNVEFAFVDTNNTYPVICNKFDMGGENGIKYLNAKSKRTQNGICVLVDGSLSDEQIFELLSKKKIIAKGFFSKHYKNISKPIYLKKSTNYWKAKPWHKY